MSTITMKTKAYTALFLIALIVAVPADAHAANLIQNGDFETPSAQPNIPQNWNAGFQGSGASSTYSYPVAGRTSAAAARVDVDNATYVSGDAKWFFTDVPVTPEKNYIYSGYYRSNTQSDIIVRFNTDTCPSTGTGCVHQNIGASLPPATDWTQFERLFTVPLGVTSLTVLQPIVGTPSSLEATSFIELDDVSLVEDAEAPIVDHVPNFSLELGAFNDLIPKSWQQGIWGDNTAVFDYVKNEGTHGTRSVKVTVSNYVSGDAKWLYAPQPVTGGKDYRFSAWYKVDALTTRPHVVAQYTKQNGDIVYYGLPRPEPSTTDWTKYQGELSIPEDVELMTIFFYLSENGSVQTDEYRITPYTYEGFDHPIVTLTFDDGAEENVDTALPTMNALGLKSTQCYMSGAIEGTPDIVNQIARVRAFRDTGHEICAHSVSHPDLTTLTPTQLQYELQHSREYLESITGLPVPNFASPFGAYDSNVIAALKANYGSHRTVNEGYNSRDNLDIYRLKVQNMNPNTTLAEFQEWVTKAKENNLWLILVYHRVTTTNNLDPYDTRADDFTAQMNWLATQNVPVLRYDEALAEVLTPTITGTSTVVAEATSAAGATVSYPQPTSSVPVTCAPLSGSAFALGTTTVTCTATNQGYTATTSFPVVVRDTTAPTLTITGADPQGIALGTTYTELGATASDAVSGDLTSSIVIDASGVNTNAVGSYPVTYRVTDAAGNSAPMLTRTVTVAQRSITVTADAKAKTIGAADPALTYQITSGALNGTDTLTGALVRTPGEAVGTYPIDIGTLSAGPNYAVNFVGSTLTIAPNQSSGSSGGGGGSSGSKVKKKTATKGTVLGAATTTPVTSTTTPATKYVFATNLYEGVRSTDVAELQKRLTALGMYTGPVTGYFGPLTKAAVVRFQVANGVPGTGFVGPLTRAALNK